MITTINKEHFDIFYGSYLRTLIWAEKPESSTIPELELAGSITPEAHEQLRAHAMSFFARCWFYVQHEEGDKTFSDLGHDFCLTSLRHGAGFWDGDWPIYGDMLTKLAKCYPSEILFENLF